MTMTILPFLLHCNTMVKKNNKFAYIHCVGLGLGIWEISPQQTLLMAEVYDEILSTHNLDATSDIDFSWFGGFLDGSSSGVFKHGII